MPAAPSRLSSRTCGAKATTRCFVEAVGHGERLRMVGDGDVFVARARAASAISSSGGAAVGLGGVHVEIAANVAEFHQFRQAALARRLRSRRSSRAIPAESSGSPSAS